LFLSSSDVFCFQVLGVSCDSHFTHLTWIETPQNEGGLGKLNIGLVADLKRKMSEDYVRCLACVMCLLTIVSMPGRDDG